MIYLLLDDKILALSKLKALAEDTFIVAQVVQTFFDRVENIFRKGENGCYLQFLPKVHETSHLYCLLKLSLCGLVFF